MHSHMEHTQRVAAPTPNLLATSVATSTRTLPALNLASAASRSAWLRMEWRGTHGMSSDLNSSAYTWQLLKEG